MATKFFENFPKIQYKLDDGRIIYIKDFFRKSKIEQDAVNSIINYTKYEIQDGERPDIVATKLYGNPDLHWTFFLVNDFENYYDWHMDNQTFERYINDKYKGYYLLAQYKTDILEQLPTGVNKFLLGEKVTQGTSEGHVIEVDPIGKRIAVDTDVFDTNSAVSTVRERAAGIKAKTFTPTSVIHRRDGVLHYKNSEGIIRNESLAGFNAVTIYDYEFEKNQDNRLIKVIQPGLVQSIVRRFEKIMLS